MDRLKAICPFSPMPSSTNVKRVRGEQMRVSFGFAVNIRRVSINKINRFEGKSVENSVFQVCSESGRMCFSKPDVLVHVKRIHA